MRKRPVIYYTLMLFIISVMFAGELFYVPHFIENGYTDQEISLILSLQAATAILFPPLIGVISDKVRSKRLVLMTGLILYSALLALKPVLIGSFALSLLSAALINGDGSFIASISETWCMEEVSIANSRGSDMSYSPIRSGSSFGYALMGLIYTLLAARAGLSNTSIMIMTSALAITAFLIVLLGKRFETVSVHEQKRYSLKELRPTRLLRNYHYITFIIAYALMHSSISFGQNYLSQLLEDVGMSTSYSGMMGFIRAIVEIPSFFLTQRLIRKKGYTLPIVISTVMMAVSNLLTVIAGSFTLVVIAQLLLGFFSGMMFLFAPMYIYDHVPNNLSATAQTLASALINCVAVIGNLLSGYLIGLYGARSVFFLCGTLTLISLILFLLFNLAGRKKETVDEA
ncbi:MAG: MFS transporter [Clostridia bacterium]|nr:MFS transporter [Clostridia bacterium]